MKTEKDKLIDIIRFIFKEFKFPKPDDQYCINLANKYMAINPQHETDGHQALEDNKPKEKGCKDCGKELKDNEDLRCENCWMKYWRTHNPF